jgi:hypothetical protein
MKVSSASDKFAKESSKHALKIPSKAVKQALQDA